MTDLVIGHLYPEHLNIYADRGNIAVFERRAGWRGIGFEVVACGPGDTLPDADLYYLGGGQDRDQMLIADDLRRKAGDLRAAVDGGASVLAVCGGYQLLGHRYRGHHGDDMPGTGLVDLETVAGDDRMIGNMTLDATSAMGCHTRWLGSRTTPAARIWGRACSRSAVWSRAVATTARTAARASATDAVIGTYVHGPLLPKNPWLADLDHRRGAGAPPRPRRTRALDDTLESESQRVAAARP